MIDIKGKQYFTLEILHQYYHDSVSRDFNMSATVLTQSVLNGLRMVSKQYGNQLIVGTELSDSGTSPLVVPTDGSCLTFLLTLTNFNFLNYTNLPLLNNNNKIYYFTNRNSTAQNGKLFLSTDISQYNSANTYNAGDLVLYTGNIYQAILPTDSGSPQIPSSNQYWMLTDANRYVSSSDQLNWLPSLSTQPSGGLTDFTVIVSGYNEAANDYSRVVYSPAPITIPANALYYTLDLSALSPGKYQLDINGSTQMIYINDELKGQNIFGVVDIYFDSTLPAGYPMLSPSNQFLATPPLYTISFLNRSTFWNYIMRSSTGVIADARFSAVPSLNITSTKPIAISDTPQTFLLNVTTGNLTVPVPSANRDSLSLNSSGNNYPYYSTIHLNY
ncbi:MAG TPA: hypothetical protein VK809_02290 [Bacteroidia bacterium]|jgi:hypothetical protein|nr:hypothetical protein [Bacteroidia bacterium]